MIYSATLVTAGALGQAHALDPARLVHRADTWAKSSAFAATGHQRQRAVTDAYAKLLEAAVRLHMTALAEQLHLPLAEPATPARHGTGHHPRPFRGLHRAGRGSPGLAANAVGSNAALTGPVINISEVQYPEHHRQRPARRRHVPVGRTSGVGGDQGRWPCGRTRRRSPSLTTGSTSISPAVHLASRMKVCPPRRKTTS